MSSTRQQLLGGLLMGAWLLDAACDTAHAAGAPSTNTRWISVAAPEQVDSAFARARADQLPSMD